MTNRLRRLLAEIRTIATSGLRARLRQFLMPLVCSPFDLALQ